MNRDDLIERLKAKPFDKVFHIGLGDVRITAGELKEIIAALSPVPPDRDDLIESPCVFCGYNGPDYWQEKTHAENCPWHNVGGGQERRDLLPAVISDHFNALSPVLPEDVRIAVMYLNDEAQEMADADMHRNAKAMHETADLIERLAGDLAQFQQSAFNPDWSLLEATQDSLREHMQLLKEAQQRIEELENILDEEQPDKAEIIELRKACKIYADGMKLQRAQIAEKEQLLDEFGEEEAALVRDFTAELDSHKTQIAEYEKAFERISRIALDYTSAIAARTELERIRGMK